MSGNPVFLENNYNKNPRIISEAGVSLRFTINVTSC